MFLLCFVFLILSGLTLGKSVLSKVKLNVKESVYNVSMKSLLCLQCYVIFLCPKVWIGGGGNGYLLSKYVIKKTFDGINAALKSHLRSLFTSLSNLVGYIWKQQLFCLLVTSYHYLKH